MFGQGNTGQNSFKGFGIATPSTMATAAPTTGFSFNLTTSSRPSSASATTSSIPETATLQFSGFGAAPSSMAATSAKPSLGGFTFGTTAAPITQPSITGAATFGLANSSTHQPSSVTVTSVTNSSLGSQLLSGASPFPLGSAAVNKNLKTKLPTSTEQPKISTGSGFSFNQVSSSTETNSALGTTGVGTATSQLSTAATSSSFGFLSGKTTSGSQLTSQSVTSTKSTSIILPTASSAVASTTEKSLTCKQLEDIINKWVHELEEQEKVFINQAKQVNTWDRLLIQNGEKITLLNSEIERLKTEQSSLDRELDFILSKQQELEEILSPLEEQMKDQQAVPYVQHADVEREKTYQMAEGIDSQLKRMMQDLKDIINHINSSNVNLQENEDPMAQIAKILNSHMDSLQWIDQSSVMLQKKVEDVSKHVESRRREHERSLRLTFD